jgi:serine/threonine protein kinase
MERIGRIEIQREIGQGGMGVVHMGYDPVLRRRVAVKTVLPSAASAELDWGTLLRRLTREGRAAAGLNHPHIVAVYDVIEGEAGFSVVMEYVEGQTLERAVPSGSCAPFERAISIISQCAAALDHAHSRNVIHRDIKPANIMLDASGAVKIADFGIAKVTNAVTVDLSKGNVLGTFDYISPERLMDKAIDGRTDQYALALVAYGILTGHKAYRGDSMEARMVKKLYQAPEPASSHNPRLDSRADAVFERALANDPAGRYDSCTQFAEDLAQALTRQASGYQTARMPAAARISFAPIPEPAPASRRVATPSDNRSQASPPPAIGLQAPAVSAAPARAGIYLGLSLCGLLLLAAGYFWFLNRSDQSRQDPSKHKVWATVAYNDPALLNCGRVADCLERKSQASKLANVTDWSKVPLTDPMLGDCMQFQPCMDRKSQPALAVTPTAPAGPDVAPVRNSHDDDAPVQVKGAGGMYDPSGKSQ